MDTQSKAAGFHPISRRDSLFEERVHDDLSVDWTR